MKCSYSVTAVVVSNVSVLMLASPVFLTLSLSLPLSLVLPPTLLGHSSRYTAVAMPLLYNTRYSSKRRVTVMISVVWVLSFAISCPLLFGLNNTGNVFFLFFFKTGGIISQFPHDTQCTVQPAAAQNSHQGTDICSIYRCWAARWLIG